MRPPPRGWRAGSRGGWGAVRVALNKSTLGGLGGESILPPSRPGSPGTPDTARARTPPSPPTAPNLMPPDPHVGSAAPQEPQQSAPSSATRGHRLEVKGGNCLHGYSCITPRQPRAQPSPRRGRVRASPTRTQLWKAGPAPHCRRAPQLARLRPSNGLKDRAAGATQPWWTSGPPALTTPFPQTPPRASPACAASPLGVLTFTRSAQRRSQPKKTHLLLVLQP